MTAAPRFETFAADTVAAVNSFGQIVTGALVSVAPAAGMLPSAYVTWRHMVDALGIDPWVAGGLAFGVDALGIGLSAARASLPRLNLTQHTQKLTVALYSYFGIVAVANICVSVQFSHSISAGIFESALALLPLPVALLMAVNNETDAVAKDADSARAVEVAKLASDRAEAAQIRAEQRDERAAIRAEKNALKVSESPKKLSKIAETFPKDWRKLSEGQKNILREMTPEEISKKVSVNIKTGESWSERLKVK